MEPYGYARVGELYPDATLFGETGQAEWDDVHQGGSGTCYILAAMAAIAEFPDLVDDVFQQTELNDEGIYAFKFHIRGIPWLVTIDDTVFTNEIDETARVEYVQIMDDIVWPALLEKAFAKVKGSYAAANGGFVETGIRSLTGAPVFTYYAGDMTDDELFSSMKEANDLDYIMGAGTYGLSDSYTNDCGVVAGHAYTIMEAFELTDEDGDVAAEVYMVRNPWGSTGKTDGLWGEGECTSEASWTDEYGDSCEWYLGSSSSCGLYDESASPAADNCCACGGGTTEINESWTDDFLSQVPHGIDPLSSASEDGVFFLDSSEI